jgi:hypothetical protein
MPKVKRLKKERQRDKSYSQIISGAIEVRPTLSWYHASRSSISLVTLDDLWTNPRVCLFARPPPPLCEPHINPDLGFGKYH